MSEARLLTLIAKHPHPGALARRASDSTLFPALHSLECRGLVRRSRGLYRLTRAGHSEVEMSLAIARLVGRAIAR
jgi:DNA-binding PadR family transcriptional regulator